MKEANVSNIRHFTDLEVWQRSHNLFLDLVVEVANFPSSTAARIITGQILRSCASISANISEGFNRTQKQFLNSLAIAKGSCNETENWLYKLRDADYMGKDRADALIREAVSISKMLQVLITRIRSR